MSSKNFNKNKEVSVTAVANAKTELDETFALSEAQKKQFREQGFIKLKNVLSKEILAHFESEVTKEVMRLLDADKTKVPNADSDTYERAFKQIPNIWTKSESVRKFVFSKR